MTTNSLSLIHVLLHDALDQNLVLSYFPKNFHQLIKFSEDKFAEVSRGQFCSSNILIDHSPFLYFDRETLWLVGQEFVAMSIDLEEISKSIKIHQKGVDPLLRAIGAKERDLSVFDFTAGTLRDAIHMVKLGHRVSAFERHPVVFALLQNALLRSSFNSLIQLRFGEAKNHSFEDSLRPDIVYFDPMFDGHDDKTAKSRKEMELYHQLFKSLPFSECEDDLSKHDEELNTLQFALSLAKKRVIVKRAPKVQTLKTPTFQMLTKAVRFDVYQL